MSRRQRPSRLIPQQPTPRKQTLLGRGQPRNKPRRRGGNLRLWPHLLWIICGLASLAGVSFALVLLYYHLLTSPLFCIKDISNIEIVGTQRFSREEILAMAGLNARTNLLALRPAVVEQTLQAHPWIGKAELARRWPNRLTLRIIERQPLALVQLEELYYLDRSGSLFRPSSPTDPHDFSVITGLQREHFPAGQRPASQLLTQTLELLAVLQEAPPPVSAKQVAEIHVDPERGFTLYLNSFKMAFEFGFGDIPEKIQKLQKVWPVMAQRGFLHQAGRLNLDHPHRVLLSLKDSEPVQ
ncbi:MAG: cell division protein FtsQ/DivIB [Desulfobaccales bacterium]